MDKKGLRKLIFSYQEKLTEKARLDLSQEIHKQVFQYPGWQQASAVALYHSIGKEVETLTLLKEGWARKKRMYLPKCYPKERKLLFFQVDGFEQLETVYMGIPEPNPALCMPLDMSTLDLMIVPGVAFDRKGYRLGYGGGYYDRFLARIPATFEKLSLAFSFQVVCRVPRDAHDIPVDTLITEKGIIDCRRLREEKQDGNKKAD